MNRRTKKIKASGFVSLLVGVGCALFAFILLAAIFTVIAYLSDDPTKNVYLFSILALILSGAAIGFIITKRSEGKLTAICSAVIFSLIMLVILVIVKKGAPSIGNVISIALYIATSALFAKIAGQGEKRHRSFRR